MILTYTAVVPRWQRQAACRGRDVEAWYPEKRKTVAEEVSAAMRVKRVCVACAVRVECLELAFDMGDPWGVWGGATPGERAAVAGRADRVEVLLAGLERQVGPFHLRELP